MECHLPYGITHHTCYPTQVNTPCLHPSQTGRYSIYRPFKDGGFSKPRPRVQRATGPWRYGRRGRLHVSRLPYHSSIRSRLFLRLCSANQHQFVVSRCRLNTYGRPAIFHCLCGLDWCLVWRSGTHYLLNSEIWRVVLTVLNKQFLKMVMFSLYKCDQRIWGFLDINPHLRTCWHTYTHPCNHTNFIYSFQAPLSSFIHIDEITFSATNF